MSPRWLMCFARERYFYDAEAIAEPAINDGLLVNYDGTQRNSSAGDSINDRRTIISRPVIVKSTRNRRTVWTIATQPYAEAHFATFPEELPKLCILAGSKPGGIVLDPFAGSGTVGKVALELGRKALLIELSAAYVKLAHERCNVTPGWF